MIAVDTNILVYAHRSDSIWHGVASRKVRELAESRALWAIPMHCLIEFFAKVTQGRAYKPASTPAKAIEQVDFWLESPSLRVLADDAQTWSITRGLLEAARITGNRAYDARIAAVCAQYGVTELWSADRDFIAYPGLNVRNPLIDIQPTGAREPRAAYVTRPTKAPADRPRKPGRGAARRR